MSTINAQTIINEVMAAHAVAPIKTESQFFDKIKFQTSARGFHTIHNSKENLQRFADMVKKNARIFGGGLIKEEKQRQAVTYATKTISLFKQLIEDHDYSAALALADEKLSPLFFMGGKGVAAMLVAPEVFEHDARLITGMTERGTWSVTEPVSMQALNGFSASNKRNRNAQIDHVMARYKDVTEEKRALAIETARQKPEDQTASRAAWIAQHGLPSEAIKARIESKELQQEEDETLGQRFEDERAKRKAAREAMAAQGVAQVLATAQAMAAIQQASTPAQAQSQPEAGELVTCEAGENEVQGVSMGNATSSPTPWAPLAQYIPASAGQVYSGLPVPPAFRGNDGQAPDDTTPPDTLESFEAGDGVSFEMIDAINRATVAQVQGLTDAQFSRLYDHLENWNFHTENYLIEALRTGDVGIVADMRQVMADQAEAGCLRGDVYDRRCAIGQRIRDAQKAQADAVDTGQPEASELRAAWETASQVNRIEGKSGNWVAWLFSTAAGLLCLGVSVQGQTVELSSHTTQAGRMAALKAQAMGADQAAGMHTPSASTNPAGGTPQAGSMGEAETPEQTPTVPQSETPRDLENDQAEAIDSEFERAKPFNLDPRALLDNGIESARLVGLGVRYTGHMANPDGRGAITSVTDKRAEKRGELSITCILEDGRVIVAAPHYFTAEIRPVLQFDSKMHGAPYLAELAMSAALAKSKHTSAKELAKQAHAQALIDLAAQFPQLKRADNTYTGGKLAAANMRILLRAAFKGVKFSVTSTYSSARVVWTDGPTDAQVQAVIGRFDIGASDTQSDYFYTVDTAFSQLFGGVQYLTTRREETDGLIQEAINQVYKDRDTKPTIENWRKHSGLFDWCGQNYETHRMREALNTISKL